MLLPISLKLLYGEFLGHLAVAVRTQLLGSDVRVCQSRPDRAC